MFWVRYLLPPGVVYVTKLSNSFGLRLCPSRIKVFRLIIPLRLFSFLWESQFTVESGSLDLKFESDYDVNEIWEVVMACAMLYLEQWIKFCGTCTSRIFIFCLGMMLVEILRWMRNSTTTISTVSHYKFHQGNHGSSILYLLLFQKIKLCVVGFFFLLFSFRAILNYLDRGRLIKNWKRKKEIICSGTYLSRCSFFLIAAFFCLVAFWLFTIGQLKILGNLSKRTTSWDLLWIKI